MKRKTSRVKPEPSALAEPAAPSVRLIEERFGPIVAAVDRIARAADPPAIRLEGAMEIVFGAYGQSDADFSELLLTGWMGARRDKHHRLALSWQREQLRLSIEEILEAGAASGAFRKALDASAVSGIILASAEGCLLQSATQGGVVPPAELVRALLDLVSGA